MSAYDDKSIQSMCCKETYTSRASGNIIYENEKIKYRNMIKPYKIKQILIK